jgi:hypothetical protein
MYSFQRIENLSQDSVIDIPPTHSFTSIKNFNGSESPFSRNTKTLKQKGMEALMFLEDRLQGTCPELR